MSGNPLKILLKLPQTAAGPPPPKPPTSQAKTSKKRKRGTGPSGHGSHARSVQEFGAERDAGAAVSGVQAAGPGEERAPGGNAGSHASSQPSTFPRLVIRGSFAKQPSDVSLRNGNGSLLDDVPGSPAKKKRKKKRRDKQPGEQLPDSKLGSKASQPHSAANVQSFPNIIAPPAKRPIEKTPHLSQQAPSTVTAQSLDGPTVTSNVSTHRQASVAGQEASSGLGLSTDISHKEIDRLLARLQKKDFHNIFRDPVTDALAPGYSKVIKRPMSFSQMQASLKAGQYTSWDMVQQDLETMFNNAMVFNEPTTLYHQKAREMMGISRKMLQMARTTVGSAEGRGRGRPPAKLDNSQSNGLSLPPDKRPERRAAAAKPSEPKIKFPKGESKRKLAAKKAAQRALSLGILARPTSEDGRGDLTALSLEDNTRVTYAVSIGSPAEQQWKGLSRGSNAIGISHYSSPLIFRANFQGAMTQEAYRKSLEAFISGAADKVKSHLGDRTLNASDTTDGSPHSHAAPRPSDHVGPIATTGLQHSPGASQVAPQQKLSQNSPGIKIANDNSWHPAIGPPPGQQSYREMPVYHAGQNSILPSSR